MCKNRVMVKVKSQYWETKDVQTFLSENSPCRIQNIDKRTFTQGEQSDGLFTFSRIGSRSTRRKTTSSQTPRKLSTQRMHYSHISGWQFSTMNQKSYWHNQSKALKGFTHDLSTSRDCAEGEKQVSAQECWLPLFYLI